MERAYPTAERGMPPAAPRASGRQRVRGSPPDREAFPKPGQRTRRGGRMMGNPGIHARRPRPQLRPMFSHRCSGGTRRRRRRGAHPGIHAGKRWLPNVHSVCFGKLFARLSPGVAFETLASTRFPPGFQQVFTRFFHQALTCFHQVFTRFLSGLARVYQV